MSKIKKIIAREILDSRGNPTIETKVILENGLSAKASAPSGASTGSYEAVELRDGDRKRYGGQGVLKAMENVNKKISKSLEGMDATKQEEIDRAMIKLDGTANKKKLGANAMLSVSLAVCRVGSLAKKEELYEHITKSYKLQIADYKLPVPCFNIFNGGKHADTNLDFQEFMVIPAPTPGPPAAHRSAGQASPASSNSYLPAGTAADRRSSRERGDKKRSFAEMVRMGAEIFHKLGEVLKKAGYDTDVGNEGGYAPDIISSVQAIELILAAGIRAGYRPEKDFSLGIDVGSSGLYNQETKKYIFRLDQNSFTANTLIGLYHEWLRKYPIAYLEDGLSEDDWVGWQELNRELGSDLMVVGDDLFTTNTGRLRLGLKHKAANAIIIKPNQVGTLSEAIECVKLAKKHNYKIIVSHRSGETNDDFIADLAVAVGADYIKAGSLSRGERLAKYNRLMEIEEQLK